MRTWILVLALGLVAGCSHRSHDTKGPAAPAAGSAAAPHAPAKAPAAAGDDAAGAPAKGAAQAGADALPQTVPLVRGDLDPYKSGRLDYRATDGQASQETHQARSKAGLTHLWSSSSPQGGYRDGDTVYTFSDGQCQVDRGRLGAMKLALSAQGLARALKDPLFGFSRALPGAELHRAGTGTVSGVAVTRYTFDAHTRLAFATVEVKGEVSLDAGHQPLSSKGTVTPSGGTATKGMAPVSWTFTASDLDGDVPVTLPAGCVAARSGQNAIASLPTPPSKTGKVTTLSGMTGYQTTAPAPKIVAFFKTALPGQGWTVDRSNKAGVWAHKGKLKITVLVMPQASGSMVEIQRLAKP